MLDMLYHRSKEHLMDNNHIYLIKCCRFVGKDKLNIARRRYRSIEDGNMWCIDSHSKILHQYLDTNIDWYFDYRLDHQHNLNMIDIVHWSIDHLDMLYINYH